MLTYKFKKKDDKQREVVKDVSRLVITGLERRIEKKQTIPQKTRKTRFVCITLKESTETSH